MKASDPRSRIFVGQGFVVKPALEQAISWIEHLLKAHPKMIAMLEFTSKGSKHRQIDCALVGPGGIDLIEIKNKRGVVRGSPEGEWTVTSRGVTQRFFNLKNRVEENPFTQARNTADDLRDWIQRTYNQKVWVSPVVWLPSADSASAIERDSFVWHAIGVPALRSKLRSSIQQVSVWSRVNYLDLPKQFQLKPIDLSFIRGRVLEPIDQCGLSDVTVIVKIGSESIQTCTDQHGQYDFAVVKDSVVEIAFAVPERYQIPPELNFVASLDYSQLEPLILAERLPRKTEAEIRQEERQRAQAEMQARISAQVEQARINWQDTHARMGLVIDDLNGQLRNTLLRLAERERVIQEQQARLEEHQRLPLPVQVQQASEVLQIQQQREQVTQALQLLAGSSNEEQQRAVAQSLDVLTQIAVSNRYMLSYPSTLVLPIKEIAQVAREPERLEPDENWLEAEAVVLSAPEATAAVDPISDPPVQSQLATQSSRASHTSLKPKPWLWFAAAVVVLLGGGFLMQVSQRGGSRPAVVPAPAADLLPETLPGKPANGDANSSTSDALPGMPVSNYP